MWIKQLTIHDYRAFQQSTTINFNKNLTIISGLNGVGKSTILAVITNVGELKRYKLLNGKKFHGEFSDVIMYDHDHDTSGTKVEITFSDLPNDCRHYDVTEKLQFRAAIQTKRSKNSKDPKVKRYRLLPVENAQKKNVRKIVWPSYYMGLSRLVPLGEYDKAKSQNSINDFKEKIIEAHASILNEKLNDTKLANLDIGTKYPKTTIASSNYGYAANSNGQDNVGQIIEAVYSFKKLKQTYPDYIGGILAIDELDASLHPSAQNNLIDWLIKMSKELNLQIVATTHSLSMIQHICDIQKTNQKNNITTNYLIKRGQKIHIETNQPFKFYKNTLNEKISYQNSDNNKINVFTEDEVARWFLQQLISNCGSNDSYWGLKHLNYLNVNISWLHLLNLLNADYDTFSNYIFILDGDVTNKDITDYMDKHSPCNFRFNESNLNETDFLRLPGSKPVEQILFDYIDNLSENDKLFNDGLLIQNGIVNKKMIDSLKEDTKSKYFPNDDNPKPINFYKKWFKDGDHQLYMKIFLKYWIMDNENEVNKFLKLLNEKTLKLMNKNNLLY